MRDGVGEVYYGAHHHSADEGISGDDEGTRLLSNDGWDCKSEGDKDRESHDARLHPMNGQIREKGLKEGKGGKGRRDKERQDQGIKAGREEAEIDESANASALPWCQDWR